MKNEQIFKNHFNFVFCRVFIGWDFNCQPYPLLEIRFSDLSNQLVAGRRFRPSEYLPGDASLQAGMPPHQPVHISLAIVDPGKEAVSFQFELL